MEHHRRYQWRRDRIRFLIREPEGGDAVEEGAVDEEEGYVVVAEGVVAEEHYGRTRGHLHEVP